MQKYISLLLVIFSFALVSHESILQAEDVELRGPGGVPLFVDSPALELWYGTELNRFYHESFQQLDLPTFASMPGSVGNHKVGLSDPATTGKMMVDTESNSSSESVAFAIPTDHRQSQLVAPLQGAALAGAAHLDLWNLVRWTSVVLIVAVLFALVLRLTRFKVPSIRATHEMSCDETLTLGQRGFLHLVSIGGERFLVATDSSGVKSVSLIPAWNLGSSPNDTGRDPLDEAPPKIVLAHSEAQ